MAIYTLGPLLGTLKIHFYFSRVLISHILGPVLGPIAGGFIAQSIGIKYIFIIISCLCGVCALIGIPLLRETYAPVIRLGLAKKSADPEKAAKAHPALASAHGSMWRIIWLNLSRPAIMLTRSFICFILSAYMAL